MKYSKVRCKQCNKVIGKDLEVKFIAKCLECSSGKKKKTRKKPIRTKSSAYAQVKKGKCDDLPEPYSDYYFRSRWEKNFARVLYARKVSWTYEERNFAFSDKKTRPFSYVPDFYVEETDTYWEIKGMFTNQDKLKASRMRDYYPDEFKKLKVCLSKHNKKAIKAYKKLGIPMVWYEDLESEWSEKVNWE